MHAVLVGRTSLRECPTCEGLWIDTASLEEICADRERQAAVLGMGAKGEDPAIGTIEQVRYLRCPVCQELMNRVNFARYSNVIVDVCKGHGTWFDRDELRRVVEFIRSGGIDEARARELAELKERQRQIKAAQTAAAWNTRTPDKELDLDRHVGVSFIADALSAIFR
jgi:Zn-finger nucleic acid-binding protein